MEADLVEYEVEFAEACEPYRTVAAKSLKEARRKAAHLSRRTPDVCYVVARDDGESVGHMIYSAGRFLRQEGRGF